MLIRKTTLCMWSNVWIWFLKGGYIVIDNVLWSGKVIAEKDQMDKDTKAIDKVNKFVASCENLQQILLPVRDGLMICRKISSK